MSSGWVYFLLLFTITEHRKCMSCSLGETEASIMGVPEPLASKGIIMGT